MIKYSKYIVVLLALFIALPSCDDGFAEKNQNPGIAAGIDPGFQLSWTQLRTSGGRYENWRAGLIYSSMMIQHMAAVCGYWTGDKYTFNSGYSSSLFERGYSEQVKEIVSLIDGLEANGGTPQQLAIANIWHVVIFHRMTDMYGDIPYNEAGRGFLDSNTRPAYDPQSDIYADMLQRLETAATSLGSGNTYGDADFVYQGDEDSWKRFANSLMLRLAMRMEKADAAGAEAWAKKAIAGGLMSGTQHDAFILHAAGPDGINRNGIGEVLDKANGFGDDCPRISNTFMDILSSTNDPRLSLIAEPSTNGGVYLGLPNGLDATGLAANQTGTSIDDFSRINANIVKVSSPMFFMTYAESELLVAEAVMKGWATGNAGDHYNNGVRAAMKLFDHYAESEKVADADIDAYLAANPFDASNGMEQIGTQFWIATFLNEYESFSNWRRTGFPNLTPVDFPGNESNSQIPRRLRYSDNEYGTNAANVEAANARQGADQFFTRVWWDK